MSQEPLGTPAGAGVVLGRGWLDEHGLVWPQRHSTRPVREVLLVSPVAGRVLETAQRWRGEWSPLRRDLHADGLDMALILAVDAMVGDRPAEPTPEPVEEGDVAIAQDWQQVACGEMTEAERLVETAYRSMVDAQMQRDAARAEVKANELRIMDILRRLEDARRERDDARADLEQGRANATEWLRQAVAANQLEMDRDEVRAEVDRLRGELEQARRALTHATDWDAAVERRHLERDLRQAEAQATTEQEAADGSD